MYIYTSSLPEGIDGILLEDMMAADRYGITDMKTLAENMLDVNDYNWIDILRVTTIMATSKLLTDVKAYLAAKYESLRKTSDFSKVKKEFADIFNELQSEGKVNSYALPIYDYSQRIKENTLDKQRKNLFSTPFPVWTIPLLLFLAVFYKHLITRYPIGPWIPVLNCIALVALVVFAYKFALGK